VPRALRSRALAGDARLLRALADPTRQRILLLLGADEMRAGDVARAFRSARPTISKHLRVLRDAGLVEARAQGRERLYRIVPGRLRDATARMQALDRMLAGGLERLGDHLRGGGPRP